MPTALRALIVEDNDQDAILLLRELKRGGYEVTHVQVDTAEAMTAALEQPWDIVLSDFSMPSFSAQAALALVKSKGLDIPFIIVSGTVGEETAVESLRAGAHDFLVKGSLARLAPAIARELREAKIRAERKRMHEQLLVSERMASVGTLAAGVAHEINNPLAILVANLEIAGQDLAALAQSINGNAGRLQKPISDAVQRLEFAQEAAERVRVIVRDLKVFSRAGEEERRGPVNVHDVLESSLRMSLNEVRHRARLVKEFGDVPAVDANESRLGQVFLNLLVNAAQSIPEGRAEANEIRVVTRRDDRGGVMTEIHDTGVGIPPEILPRIFDPFFTTKPVGVGTGLGLAICHRIVTDLGGRLTVESQPGRGSIFRLTLPAIRATELDRVSAPAPAAAPQTAERRRVLVLDDEQALCEVVRQILAKQHDVVAFTVAGEALQHLRDGARFDVILCDLMMPQMSGIDFHAALVEFAPDQARRIVFMTGGAFTENARAFLERMANSHIEKPFRGAALRELIQRDFG